MSSLVDENKKYELEELQKHIPTLGKGLNNRDDNVKGKLVQFYYYLVELLIGDEPLRFTTEFAAISYLGVKYNLSGDLLFRLHAFRKTMNKADNEVGEIEWKSGFYALCQLLFHCKNETLPAEFQEFHVAIQKLKKQPEKKDKYIRIEKVLWTGKKTEQGWEALREDEGSSAIIFEALTDDFKKNLEELSQLRSANVLLMLKEISVDTNGIWRPKVIIIEPDFILDVTAIASCVMNDYELPSIHLLKKFLPPKTTKYLMGGHVANYFLDSLISEPSSRFEDLMRQSFFIDPVSFCTLPDEDIKYIASKSRDYYLNIQKIIKRNFLIEGRELHHFSVEPSFYSPQNGIQGRLDLLYRNPSERRTEIFELKSGSVFKPNAYNINASHYAQTMLYYMIIKDLYPNDINLSAYIIYAKEARETVRYAPSVKHFQNKTMSVRNRVLLNEMKIQDLDKIKPDQLFSYLDLDILLDEKGFTGQDAANFKGRWEHLDEVEKKYFLHSYAFVSREYRNSKVNNWRKTDRGNGLSAIWLEDLKSKEERFSIYTELRLKEDLSGEENPLLILSKKNCPQKLANFRKGDVVVLYAPALSSDSTPFAQIYRATLVEIDGEKISLRLRSKLSRSDAPDATLSWVLEPDVLESGFNHFFRSLAMFLNSSAERRSLWMGRRLPDPAKLKDFNPISGLTEEQNRVIQKIISSKDYFLLWGPPGTGKTSVVIKQLIRQLVVEEKENILLLAYTNRAVDEICDAVKSWGEKMNALAVRIGSRYGVGVEHHDLLFDKQLEKFNSRREVVEWLNKKKIFVSTVSSYYGKSELRKLIKFDTVIIDEASQILEPYLVGLVSGFNRTILIGDHCQLPAIVTQYENESKINDIQLKDLGMEQLSDSLFERLFRLCLRNGADHAFDKLSYQGRMHRDICDFVSHQFYKGKLQCLNSDIPNSERLRGDLSDFYPAQLPNFLRSNRKIFLDQAAEGLPLKTHEEEAESAVQLIKTIVEKSALKPENLSENLIGIICPYRAQIALIKSKLENWHPVVASKITVDTVERYQGGARDIIILSLCINHPSQLNTLINANREGLDRKLNVALTRAREQLIILGNKEILSSNPTYQQLIENCTEISSDFVTV
ncbi:MAG: hypothetical protein EA362_08340 [Saprospirales bacterium]|nr:MAG: hypothetical protein EA362_08340 [Saprospirales bacterium]